MKNKIGIILLAGTFLSSCELVDVLDKEPPHNMTPETAIVDEKSAETALTGVYGNLLGYDSFQAIGNQAFTTGMLRANPKTGGGNNILYTERNMPKLSYVSMAYDPFWNNPTMVINSGNQLLNALEGMSDGQFSGNRKTTMMGEVRFLRAFSNFEMLRLFGQYDKLDSKYGMTLRKKPATVNDVMLKRSTVRETYDFILEDLNYAIQNAPDFKDATKASKTAAKALKVKVLFFMGNYPEALELANSFIASGERTLEQNYADVFTNKKNSELIFVRGFEGTIELQNQSTRVNAFHNEGKWGPSELFLEYVAGDPREQVILKNGVGAMFGSYKTINKAANAKGDMPLYWMRFSEIYMIKAECEMRAGNSSGAIVTLNDMRGAHGLSLISGNDDVKDVLFKEWVMEMGFENGHEWHALWRLGGVERLLQMNETVRELWENNVDPDMYKESLVFKQIYPIPAGEISANKLSVQNPGYN